MIHVQADSTVTLQRRRCFWPADLTAATLPALLSPELQLANTGKPNQNTNALTTPSNVKSAYEEWRDTECAGNARLPNNYKLDAGRARLNRVDISAGLFLMVETLGNAVVACVVLNLSI
ncbi:unnamed protein product, partial [Iphiclides podalirius]